jgi:hypothetical protein
MIRRSLAEGIIYVENFLPENEIKILQDFCKSDEEWGSIPSWDSESLWQNNTRHVASSKEATMALYKVNIAMGELVNSKTSVHRPNYTINRFTPQSNPAIEGSTFWDSEEWSMGPHYDSDYGPPLNDHSGITHGALFYINDDYEGGELVYTEKNIIFKPKANTLIIHGGAKEFTHGVKKVTSGERYTLSTFAFTAGSMYV